MQIKKLRVNFKDGKYMVVDTDGLSISGNDKTWHIFSEKNDLCGEVTREEAVRVEAILTGFVKGEL